MFDHPVCINIHTDSLSVPSTLFSFGLFGPALRKELD